jgi:hypothetical protein
MTIPPDTDRIVARRDLLLKLVWLLLVTVRAQLKYIEWLYGANQ